MNPVHVVLLIAHVFAAIMFVGGATIAAAIFPRYAAWHFSTSETVNPAGDPPLRQEQVLRALARITRNYGTGALLVPLLGLLLALIDDRLGEAWVTISLVLAAAAAYLLIVVVRMQEDQLRLVRTGGDGSGEAVRARVLQRMRLASTGFNFIWLAILVLMVWRPGGHA